MRSEPQWMYMRKWRKGQLAGLLDALRFADEHLPELYRGAFRAALPANYRRRMGIKADNVSHETLLEIRRMLRDAKLELNGSKGELSRASAVGAPRAGAKRRAEMAIDGGQQ